MRLALALTAVAAAVAAVPAAADAPQPVCTVRVLHSDPGGPAATCTTDGAPRFRALITYRVLDVAVAAGAVEATISCATSWGPNSRSAVFSASASRQSVRVVEHHGEECVATLVALTENTTAVGVSDFVYTVPRPAA